MRFRIIPILTVLMCLVADPGRAADEPRTITVSTSAKVSYQPDLARVSFAVRQRGSDAKNATALTNESAQRIIASLRRIGIPSRDIQTTDYTVEYKPLDKSINEKAHYEAAENVSVLSAVEKASAVIDSALAAGANSQFNLSFDTSNAQQLYLEALAIATESAKAQANKIAATLGVTLAGVSSVTTNNQGFLVRGASADIYSTTASASAPVLSGTESISASVQIGFLIK